MSARPCLQQAKPSRGREEAAANGKAKKGKGRSRASAAAATSSRSGTRRRGGAGGDSAEAGPPIGGAVLRIEAWPAEFAANGAVLDKPVSVPLSARSEEPQCSCVRLCQPHGLQQRSAALLYGQRCKPPPRCGAPRYSAAYWPTDTS